MGVGINLKRLRGKTKYSQQNVADLLDIDRLTYVNWEKEATEIKASYIPKLAEIFNVDIQDLFDGEKKMQINHFGNNDTSSASAQQGIIINISDKETAEKFSLQIQKLIEGLTN